MRRLGPLLTLIVAAWATTASASTITYTVSGVVDGSLAGVSFLATPLTITTVSDTSSVQSTTMYGYNLPALFNPGTTTFTLGAVTGTITGANGIAGTTMGAFTIDARNAALPQGNYLANIGFQWDNAAFRPSFVYSALLGTFTNSYYDMVTSYSFTGTPYAGDNYVFDTTAGTLQVTSANSNSTFTASLNGSPVPEIDPAGMGSVMALVTGALGLVERRRRLPA